MKPKFHLFLSFLAAIVLASSISAADIKPTAEAGHTHAKKTAGPNGGRVIEGIEPRAEFFVTPERKVQITFLAKDDTPITPDAQNVAVTAGERTAPTRLTFAKTGNVLLSNAALPAGNDFPVVVEITPAPGGKKVLDKFYFDSAQCSECKHAEYACICEH
ncbi:MAG TPA: hypothetical protein VL069_03490 [Opitutus sp.]|nr:hypothetical protein [Opitutus sp.]